MHSSQEPNQRASLRSRALSSLRGAGIDPSNAIAWFIPGRIEFLGKHTDYCGGRSLLCAVERGICFAAVPRGDSIVRVVHRELGETIEFPLDVDAPPQSGEWFDYLITVGRRIARNFPGRLGGADVAVEANLPPAAGMSSSSALIVGMFLALSEINSLDRRPEYQACIRTREDLAGYLGTVENGQTFQNAGSVLSGDRGVGTLGGSQDHTAILCSVPGRLVQYRFSPVVQCEGEVPVPAGHRFVVASCGIAAEKTGGAQNAYNRNPLIVRDLLKQWNDATHRDDAFLASAIRSDPSAIERIQRIVRDNPSPEFTKEVSLARLNQFVEESERIIPAAAAAMRSADLRQLGSLVDESQRLSIEGLGNQIPQTEFLATEARKLGAAAASAFGAGFGGSVWALVDDAAIDKFQEKWLTAYRQRFPNEAELASVFITQAGAGAFRFDSLEMI